MRKEEITLQKGDPADEVDYFIGEDENDIYLVTTGGLVHIHLSDDGQGAETDEILFFNEKESAKIFKLGKIKYAMTKGKKVVMVDENGKLKNADQLKQEIAKAKADLEDYKQLAADFEKVKSEREGLFSAKGGGALM